MQTVACEANSLAHKCLLRPPFISILLRHERAAVGKPAAQGKGGGREDPLTPTPSALKRVWAVFQLGESFCSVCLAHVKEY